MIYCTLVVDLTRLNFLQMIKLCHPSLYYKGEDVVNCGATLEQKVPLDSLITPVQISESNMLSRRIRVTINQFSKPRLYDIYLGLMLKRLSQV